MVHVSFKARSILCHRAGVPQMQQLIHLQFELLRPKFFADRRTEGVPPERVMSLTVRLKPVSCLSLDVQRRRGHPIVWRYAVQLEVGDTAIDPKVQA